MRVEQRHHVKVGQGGSVENHTTVARTKMCGNNDDTVTDGIVRSGGCDLLSICEHAGLQERQGTLGLLCTKQYTGSEC